MTLHSLPQPQEGEPQGWIERLRVQHGDDVRFELAVAERLFLAHYGSASVLTGPLGAQPIHIRNRWLDRAARLIARDAGGSVHTPEVADRRDASPGKAPWVFPEPINE